MNVWLNGKIVSEDKAQISIFDSSIQHGVGVFETMYARKTEVFRLDNHLEQLFFSAKNLKLVQTLRLDLISNAIDELLVHSNYSESRLKLTLTGGMLGYYPDTNNANNPTIIITCQKSTKYPADFFQKGVLSTISRSRENPHIITSGHKSIDYWSRISALQEASLFSAGESIWLTPEANIASGSVSNVFCVKDGVLKTPPARFNSELSNDKSPVRPGVTRGCVIDLAKQFGYKVEINEVSIDAFLNADESFLTNSSWGILPVVGLCLGRNSKNETGPLVQKFGSGVPGPVTQELRRRWLDCLDMEIGSL